MKKISLVLVLAMLMSFTAFAATEESAVWDIQDGWNGMFIATAQDAVAYEAKTVEATQIVKSSTQSIGSAALEGNNALFMRYGMGEAGAYGRYGHLYAYTDPLKLEDGKTYTVTGYHLAADTGVWTTAFGIGSFNEEAKTVSKKVDDYWINDTALTQTDYSGYWKKFSFDFTYDAATMGDNLSFYAYIRSCGYRYAAEFAIDNVTICEKGTNNYIVEEGFGLDEFGTKKSEIKVNGNTAYVTALDDFYGDVILASYTGDGTLVDAKVFEKTFLYDNKLNEFDITDLGRSGATTIRMFLWDSMRPATVFDDVNGDYNTITVDGANVTAKIKIEDDIAGDITVYTANQYGNNDAVATVTEENGYYIISGKFSNYKAPAWGTWRGINITEGGIVKRRYSCDFEKAPTNAYAAELIENMANETEMLETLIAECKNEGISTDYEELYKNVINYYISHLEEDLLRGDYRYIWYSYDRCMNLYDEAKENLIAYLNGDKTSLSVPKYVTGDIDVDGTGFIANTKQSDGTEEIRPVHLVGYNYFDGKEGIDDMAAAGANHIQKEMGPDSVIVEGKTWKESISGTGMSAELSTAKKKSGTQSLFIKNTASAGTYVIEQNIKVQDGTTYYFGLSALASGVTSAKVTFLGTTIQIPTTTISRWRDFSASVTTSGSGMQTFKIEITGKATSLYLDDVFVSAGSASGTNLVANSGFESAFTGDKEWRVDYNAINEYCELLKTAEENNVTVDFLISTHYVPAFLKAKYPDIFANQSQYMSDLYREVVKDYLDAVIPAVSQYKSLKTICLMNEPGFRAADYGEEYNVKYREFLKNKYGTVANVNSVWGTNYGSFDSISMPAHASNNNSAQYHDYFLFNNTLLTDYHQFLADTIRAHTDIPLHSKPMWVMGSYDSGDDRSRWNGGVDWTALSDITDYVGCDNIYYLQNLRMDWYRDEMSKAITYDYMAGLKEAPVVNSEDHIIMDYDLDMSEEQKKVNTTDVWQNAFHNRSQSALWAWSRPTNGGSILFGGLGARPDVVAEIGATIYDLNRLSWEIKAVNDQKAEIGVLYSDYSRRYSASHMTHMYSAYEALYFGGYKAAIIPEARLEDIGKNIKMLVLPSAERLTAATIDKLYSLANSGVKIVILQEQIGNDEYNKPHSGNKVAAIKNMATSLRYPAALWTGRLPGTDLRDDLIAIAKNVCTNSVQIKDVSTGKLVDNTEYILGFKDGKAIVSVCNYDWRFATSPTIEVYVNGKKLTNMTELRSNENVGDRVTIKPFEPILLSASIN